MKREWSNPYVPGDFIPGAGMVDTNHCGLPWVVTCDGYLFCGCVHVIDTNAIHDALDGRKLSDEEIQERKGNLEYDYANRTKPPYKRPQREINAISQSLMDRYGFMQGILFTIKRRTLSRIKMWWQEFWAMELAR